MPWLDEYLSDTWYVLKEAADILGRLDKDNSGDISFEEFEPWHQHIHRKEQQHELMFINAQRMKA
jgi:hypothetical protein